MIHKQGLMLSVAALVTSTEIAQAQGRPQGFEIGVGAIVSTAPFIGEAVEATPIPFIAYTGENFSVGANGIEANVFEFGQVTVSGVVRPRFSELDDPDAPELASINRSITGDVGVSLSYGLAPRTKLNVEFLQEFTGEHGGQEVSFGLSYDIAFRPVRLTASVGGVWQSASLTEYLYGVLADETTASLSAFSPGSAVSPTASLRLGYDITPKIGFFGLATATILPDAIQESPIVSDGATFSLLTGVSYRF